MNRILILVSLLAFGLPSLSLACSMEESPAVFCGFVEEIASKSLNRTAVGIKSSKPITQGFYDTSCSWKEIQTTEEGWTEIGEFKKKNALKIMKQLKALSKTGEEVCVYRVANAKRDRFSVELRNERSTKEVMQSASK